MAQAESEPSGAPFTVLDSQDALDCSHWPAGDYELKEAYRNDLGQTTEDWLNLTIHNRPAPEFSLWSMAWQYN